MKKVEFVTIFTTYGKIDVVKKTLSSVVKETETEPKAAVIVMDTTVGPERESKWRWLQDKYGNHDDVFLVLASNTSLAIARNTCLHLAQELYTPEFICMIDDDHGYKTGILLDLMVAMDRYYGEEAPNGLRFGLFTGCNVHRNGNRCKIDKHLYPDSNCPPGTLGGTNGCFRCAPTRHWNSVLKGYDVDEYLISYYQSRSISTRNYNRGYTTMIVNGGDSCFFVENEGRGDSTKSKKRWDDLYTASDKRADFKR